MALRLGHRYRLEESHKTPTPYRIWNLQAGLESIEIPWIPSNHAVIRGPFCVVFGGLFGPTLLEYRILSDSRPTTTLHLGLDQSGSSFWIIVVMRLLLLLLLLFGSLGLGKPLWRQGTYAARATAPLHHLLGPLRATERTSGTVYHEYH